MTIRPFGPPACAAALVAVLVMAALAPPALADAEYDALTEAWDAAQTAYIKALREYEAAQTQPATQADGAPQPPGPAKPAEPLPEFSPRFKAYAEKHAKTPAAIEALVWLVTSTTEQRSKPAPSADATWAIARLIRDHAGDPALEDEMKPLRYAVYAVGTDALEPLFNAVRAAQPSPAMKSAAAFNLAYGWYEQIGAAAADGRRTANAAESEKAAGGRTRGEQLFREIVRTYPGTPGAESAERYIFEIEHLQVGMPAPEITGEDVDGHEIKLSALRGKVVVLDFWGYW